MPKTVRFHEARYHNAYGFFEKDSVYTDIPDDYTCSSGDQEIDPSEVTQFDNVRTKPYHALTTSGITKEVVDGRQPKRQRKSALAKRPSAGANAKG
jgi:hypothetical protein